MADINLAPSNYELEAIQKRRKMAELLIQQAQQPMDMPQVAGARISPVAGLAKLLKAYTGSQKLKKSEEEEKQYQSDYLSDLGFLMRNAGKSTPATEAIPEKIQNISTPNLANQNLQEIAVRQSTMRDRNAAINPFEKQLFAGMDKGQTSEKLQEIGQMPSETVEQRVTPAVPAMKGSPLLSPDLLSGNNANNYLKTSQGKMLLAQLLTQQQAQQQAAALKSQEVLKRNPEEDLYRVVDGKVETLSAGKPKAKLREVKTNNPVTGMPETRYYPEDVLVAMGGIPDQYKGFAAELIMAKNLPAQILKDPQLLNLVGSQLNKQAGLVTEEDVANYMLKVQEARAKLGYEGIPFAEPKGLTAASNPLIKSVPLPPQGTQLINGQVYDTPKGRGRWNGTTFILVD